MLARLQNLGLRGIARLTLTRNARVLVSYRAAALRLHEAYVHAPAPLLQAIVSFVNGPAHARTAAVRTLRSFPIAPAVRRTPRRATTHPDDQDLLQRLYELHAELNARCFGGLLGRPTIHVSRRMRRKLGHYALPAERGSPGLIALSRRHIRRHGWIPASETLLHEMIHQWQHESGLAVDHGPSFRRRAGEVGLERYVLRSARRARAAALA
ncbi:MAG: SprT-like domain-containing protein [Gemmatimonadaceae bacterium]